jgi:uncharacterized protein YlxW (UPF0749 family)
MDSGQLMVVMIVAIVMIAGIIKAGVRGGAGRGAVFHYQNEGSDPKLKAEATRLREEVQELKERIKVLERITVEKENSLAREIESLRDG